MIDSLCRALYIGSSSSSDSSTFLLRSLVHIGFPGGAGGKEPTCQCRRHKRYGFNPWVGKIPWKLAWQPTPVFLPGKFHGRRSLVGCKELDMTEQLHLHSSYFCSFMGLICELGFQLEVEIILQKTFWGKTNPLSITSNH